MKKQNFKNYNEEHINTAIARMKAMGLSKEIIDKFADGEIMMSLSGKPGTATEGTEDAQAALDSMEFFEDLLPYHVIKSRTLIGDQYAVLYVSSNHIGHIVEDEEQGYVPGEIVDSDGSIMAYVYNTSCPDAADFISIEIQVVNGALIRIG